MATSFTNGQLNFIELYNDCDKNVLRTYCDEMIDVNGFPCILKRWTGNTIVQDPLYQDTIYGFTNDAMIYEPVNTHIYIDYNRLMTSLQSFGVATDTNFSLNGMMKLCDNPTEDDIIELKSPYDGRLLSFTLGSVNNHKDIVYNVVLNIRYINCRDYAKTR